MTDKYLTLFFIMIFLGSCRKEVLDEFPEFERRPVINTVFKTDSALRVHVSFADKIQADPIPKVEDATVVLQGSLGNIDTLNPIGGGLYQTTNVIQPKTKYILSVSIPGYDIINCSVEVPSYPEILGLKFNEFLSKDDEGMNYSSVEVNSSRLTGKELEMLPQDYGQAYKPLKMYQVSYFPLIPTFSYKVFFDRNILKRNKEKISRLNKFLYYE